MDVPNPPKDFKLGKWATKFFNHMEKSSPRPAVSRKIDKWIDDRLDPILLAIPFGAILSWGAIVLFLGYLAYGWAKTRYPETTKAYVEHLFPNSH